MSILKTAAPKGRDRVCIVCIHDPYLKTMIGGSGKRAKCDYCSNTGLTISLDELVDKVESMFSTHFERTPESPPENERQYWYQHADKEWERSGETNLEVLRAHVTENPDLIRDLIWALGDIPLLFEDEPTERYEPILPSDRWVRVMMNTSEWWEEWSRLEEGIWKGSRFFNEDLEGFLSRIFQDLADFTSADGEAVIREWHPGEEELPIFRARAFDTADEVERALLHPVSQLSAPPSESATGGRMNPLGASLFYAATNPETAISEVRPYVGAFIVVVRFHLLRRLRLLDFSALRSSDRQGSLFDPEHQMHLSRGDFLSELVARLTRPLAPNVQNRGYLVSQIVSDFLEHKLAPSVDGVIYPSAQAPDGLNIILFRRSQVVEDLEKEGKTISNVEHDIGPDGSLPSYSVTTERAQTAVDRYAEPMSFARPDPSLRIDLDTLSVRHVNQAMYKTTAAAIKFQMI